MIRGWKPLLRIFDHARRCGGLPERQLLVQYLFLRDANLAQCLDTGLLKHNLLGGRRSLAKFTEFRLEEIRDIVCDHDVGRNQYQRNKCRKQYSEA
jgi:hypothetical protein